MTTHTARFDLRIYSAQAIEQAIEAFADFATLSATADGDCLVVQGDIDGKTARQVWGEFQNYILVNS